MRGGDFDAGACHKLGEIFCIFGLPMFQVRGRLDWRFCIPSLLTLTYKVGLTVVQLQSLHFLIEARGTTTLPPTPNGKNARTDL